MRKRLAFGRAEVSPASELSGRKLKETTIRSELDIIVAAIRRAGGEMIFNPSADAVIKTGDLLIATGRADSLAELSLSARGTKAGAKRRA